MKKSCWIIACVLATAPAFAQPHSKIRAKPAPGKSAGKVHYGTASFYANKFEGRKMANGARFHQANMTAASNTLPLGSFVRVTNRRNGKSVFLRITDRMNKTNKRLIDLSHAAAHKLNYTGYGLARVKVELLPNRPAQYIASE